MTGGIRFASNLGGLSLEKRIKEIRRVYNLNQTQFAEKIGLKQPTIAGYENGKDVPMSTIVTICQIFPEINKDWLRTGKGEMKLEQSEDDVECLVNIMRGANENKKHLVRILANMPDEMLDEMISYLKKEIK